MSTIKGCIGSCSDYLELQEGLSDQLLHVSKIVLIVDGYSFLYDIINHKEITCGAYRRISSSIRSWIERLDTFNITPVFVFDGQVEQRKLTSKLRRMSSQAQTLRVLPYLLHNLVIQLLQSMEIRTIHASGEADAEIVRVACSTCASAILSNDTDFFAYEDVRGVIPHWALQFSEDGSRCCMHIIRYCLYYTKGCLNIGLIYVILYLDERNWRHNLEYRLNYSKLWPYS
jgi:hypothetical protein